MNTVILSTTLNSEATKWILVFLVTLLYDVIFAKYTQSAASSKALSASIYSVLLIIGGSLTVYLMVRDVWLLIPECLGAFIGTYIAVKRHTN